MAVPEAARSKKIDRVIGGKQKEGTMSDFSNECQRPPLVPGHRAKFVAHPGPSPMWDGCLIRWTSSLYRRPGAELARTAGPQASPQTIGYYGGAIAAVQLLGWGVGGLIFGILGDYWGRARTLCLSILVLCGLHRAVRLRNDVVGACHFQVSDGRGRWRRMGYRHKR